MSWVLLFGSSILEAVWAISLSLSEGFSKLAPSVVFVVALITSSVGLAIAMRNIPTGTAYAVWTGTGAALTVIASVVFGLEAFTILKMAFIVLIIGCVVGIKVLDAREHKNTGEKKQP